MAIKIETHKGVKPKKVLSPNSDFPCIVHTKYGYFFATGYNGGKYFGVWVGGNNYENTPRIYSKGWDASVEGKEIIDYPITISNK